MKNRKLQKIFAFLCAIALLLSVSAETLAKLDPTAEGTQKKFGIARAHNSKYLNGSAYNMGSDPVTLEYIADSKTVYRVYAGENESSGDFKSAIICLDRGKSFPGESSNEGNYKSLGSLSQSSLSYKDKLDWLINNAIIPDDSPEMRDQKLAQIFSEQIRASKDTVNPLRVSDIKRAMTEDDIMIALQIAAWNVTDGYIMNNIKGRFGEIESSLLGNNPFGENKGTYIKEMAQYYINGMNSGTPSPDTGEAPAFTMAPTESITNEQFVWIGQFTLKNTTRDYTIDISFYDENDNKLDDVNYMLFNTNTPTSTADILSPTKEDLNGKSFYIRVRRTTKAKKVKVTLQPKISATTVATVWAPQDDNQNSQQLLSIERTEEDTPPVVAECPINPGTEVYSADLALRKHISAIITYDTSTGTYLPEKEIDGTSEDRTPQANESSNKEYNEYEYKHRKDPYQLDLSNPDYEYYVLYTFNVYNEHPEQNVALTQITDYLPPKGLEFVKKNIDDFDDINQALEDPIYFYNTSKFDWTYSSDSNAVVLNVQAEEITHVDSEGIHSCTPKSLVLKVTDEARGKIVTNIAEVTGYTTREGNNVLDHDSGHFDDDFGRRKVVLPTDEAGWENYRGYDNKSQLDDKTYYYKGQEDDDDFEKIQVKGSLDIALRKNLTHVNGTQVNPSRIGDIVTSDLMTGEGGTADYNDEKTSYPVNIGDLVTFKIRLINEGQTEAYAKEVKDYIPKGLAFIPQYDMNISNGWSVVAEESGTAEPLRNWDKKSRVTNSSLKGVTVDNATVFLGPVTIKSSAKAETPLTPFNKATQTLDDSVVLQVTCLVVDPFEVNEAIEQKVLRNVAIVSSYGDSNGNTPTEDYDSKSDNITTRDQINNFSESGHQDDEDFDKLIVSKQVNFYDLALKKYIIGIKAADGQTVKQIPNDQKRECKVENTQDLVNRDPDDPRADAQYSLNKPIISIEDGDYITYKIRIYNEGQQDAVVKKVVDSIPKGLEFVDYEKGSNNQYISGSYTNYTYGWERFTENVNGNTGWTEGVRTEYLNNERLTIKAFDPSKINEEDKGLSYQDIEIEFKVNLSKLSDAERAAIMTSGIINTAEIYDHDTGATDVDSWPNNKDTTEDDIDQDRVYPGVYDLALQKAVTEIVGKTIPDNQKRTIRVYNTDALKNRANNTKADATYEVNKSLPVSVQDGDHVVYTIRVYNEGRQNAKVLDLRDTIPTGLEFAEYEKNDNGSYKSGSRINHTYGWNYKDGDNENVYTEYLADKQIPAFDNSQSSDTSGKKELGLSYEEVKIEFVVNLSQLSATEKNKLTRNGIENIAEITSDDGNDNDSETNNDNPAEDDQDNDLVIPKEFDLALRKFILWLDQNNTEPVGDRTPKVTYKNGQLSYSHDKTPVIVHKDSIVTYAIRVYNEGSQDGYAAEITDTLPNGLKFQMGNTTNEEYGWVGYDKDGNVSTDEDEIVTIKTEYLSKANEKTPGENLIRAFDSSKAINQGEVFDEHSDDFNPDYRDIIVCCYVDKDPTENPKVLTNVATITEDTDENGKPVEDIDTDDITDTESVEMKYFDLSLLKYVTKVMVTEDGVTKEIETGYNGLENPEPIVKIELNGNKVNSTDVKYLYTIKITNEGEVDGYALEVTDRIPEGLAFVEADNTQWGWKVSSDGIIKTEYVANQLLKPGQSVEIPLILTWVKGSMGIKVNTAEISLDYNEHGIPDYDSHPNNNNESEDDQDDAIISIQVSTGSAPIYLTLIISVLAILGTGSYLIYRYVLKRD